MGNAARAENLTYHVGHFIQSYLNKRCPQAQARVLPVHDTWQVDVLRKDYAHARDTQAGKLYPGGNIYELCHNVLTMAGYERKTGDDGEIYYG